MHWRRLTTVQLNSQVVGHESCASVLTKVGCYGHQGLVQAAKCFRVQNFKRGHRVQHWLLELEIIDNVVRRFLTRHGRHVIFVRLIFRFRGETVCW